MDWQSGDISNDIEDRRGESGGGGGGGFGGGGLGIIGFIVLAILSLVTGRNFLSGMFHGGGTAPTQSSYSEPRQQSGPVQSSAGENRDVHLISYTLNDVQETWTKIFAQEGRTYKHAKLVLFRDQTYSGCGTAQSSTGPFYCPADQKVYIDLGFWDELTKFGGSTADFAQSYVVAHELGHHVQNLMGTEAKVRRLMQQEPSEQNHLSVDLELQADCYAGVWGHSSQQRGVIKDADIAEALKAAAAVGDDHLQKMSGRSVSPESWTHGSSAQRESWFRKGLESGDPASCNTFGGS